MSKLLELAQCILRSQTQEAEGVHHPGARGGRNVQEQDRLLELVDPALDALGDDRIGAIVEGDIEPGHRLFGDLDLFALLVGDELLDPLAQERLEQALGACPVHPAEPDARG